MIPQMIIQLLMTGSELMSGNTTDSNSTMISQSLATLGLTVHKKITIGDNQNQLIATIQEMATHSELLIVNGGLGPTVDDLTAQSLALASDCKLEQNEQALAHLQSWCEQRGLKLNSANMKQAMLPIGVDIVPNSRGSAVGFSMYWQKCLIICTPGVPSELRTMLSEEIIPLIESRHPDHPKIITERFQTFGIGESSLQQLINEQLPDWPDSIELGFRAGAPQLEIKIRAAESVPAQEISNWRNQLQQLLGAHIIGSNDCQLAQLLIYLLHEKKKTITTAESCTGGRIATMLTEVAGASSVFEAGFVTYSNSMKNKLLGVKEQSLQNYGAVSQQVVTDMALGALNISGADYVVAVSGIAGPDGGTEQKPVGSVWLAWGTKENLKSYFFRFRYGRKLFQTMVSAAALDLIRRELLECKDTPYYLKEKKAAT